jgi:hydrogenase maturation protein HypF
MIAAVPSPPSTGAVRHRIRVAGVVQGVGFRPFVHRLATELDLAGHVGNDTDGVLVEVEGSPAQLGCFQRRLLREAPPLARIFEIETSVVGGRGEPGFHIVESCDDGVATTFVSPDVAVCAECLAEMLDPADRRYRYPFINCTNCGPRFTIMLRLPYDRPHTTMAGFPMCATCAREYSDPRERRFHAQPIACADCGPRVWFESATGGGEAGGAGERGEAGEADNAGDTALAAAQRALVAGQIVAVKGLGGFHLACDATAASAVEELRRRKHRMEKPFAVMVADLAQAQQIAEVDEREAALLTSPQRPIVLLRRREGSPLTPLVAPGNPYVGVLLPYTPLHHLLFRPVPGSTTPVPTLLVMTSGNLTDEPICYDDDDARRRLAGIVDSWLVHDRPIHVPCDDSVVRIEGGEELPIRRARGYAPLPVRLPRDAGSTLATGGELKNTFCLAAGRNAWMSSHIGDMGSVETLGSFERSIRQFADVYSIDPEGMAADAHPGYHARQWAEAHAGSRRLTLIQHHHAHIASLMAERGVPAGQRVIGLAFDGTGYGTDGSIWGGEVLVAGYDGFDRAAHLRYIAMPGGDATIRKPYRSALAHLWAAGIEWTSDLAPVRAAPEAERQVLARQLQRDVLCVPTSSMGRLFDAVSSLLGLRHTVSYEAQAAIELEVVAAAGSANGASYRFALEDNLIDPRPLLRAIVSDLRTGHKVGDIASAFHIAVARLIADSAERLRATTGIDCVALSGGVFQNVLVTRLARAELVRRHFTVLTHRLVPPNDGGLALGQVAIASGIENGHPEA